MAHLYKRGRQFWISYYVNRGLVQKSLKTTSERIARAKKKRLEYDLALGDLHIAREAAGCTRHRNQGDAVRRSGQLDELLRQAEGRHVFILQIPCPGQVYSESEEGLNDQPVIVSFCCNRCAYPAADSAGLTGIQYPANILIIRTVCSGMIHPNIIMDALTQGADGVLMYGCQPGNCRSREGIRKALDRKEAIELMLGDFGMEPGRFRLEHIAASESSKFAQIVKDMTDELLSLGPNPYR